jgi:hypothetical protein
MFNIRASDLTVPLSWDNAPLTSNVGPTLRGSVPYHEENQRNRKVRVRREAIA